METMTLRRNVQNVENRLQSISKMSINDLVVWLIFAFRIKINTLFTIACIHPTFIGAVSGINKLK